VGWLSPAGGGEDDGAKPQKPELPIPSAGILITKTGPAQFGGSVNECIHTDRRLSTGEKDD